MITRGKSRKRNFYVHYLISFVFIYAKYVFMHIYLDLFGIF